MCNPCTWDSNLAARSAFYLVTLKTQCRGAASGKVE